ncbi:hypothetical protein LNKW23_03200 [Paralimibaculum aggregatum]|uniref:VCBS repeat-containing protein n=1 Tax=Paralimibaculum aggregatum TaxID=3036245 RepID=A0ABQ6LCK4_9RHOB|nr:VCBS repeat-containing protein [Limibaculum sp. NKW23]GMG81108.1 hypothetical protein LNKW23_03200 [Limibaculum sp. NKW23]
MGRAAGPGGAPARRRRIALALAPAAIAALLAGPRPGAADTPGSCVRDTATGLGACLEDATARYGHGVLGEGGEWERLSLGPRAGPALTHRLGAGHVFEDLHPRLADLDGDGFPEIVTVRSGQASGAAILVYSAAGGRLREIAATPAIGRRHRWRAIAGIAELDGAPGLEIAEVDRPHLAGILRIWSFRDGRLTEIAAAAGFSNHRIGESAIRSVVRRCADGPEVVLPDRGWTELVAVRLEGGALRQRRLGLPASDAGLGRALACR